VTKDERLTEAARRAKEKLTTNHKALAKIESAQRHEQRKARNKRRYVVGTLADKAGLLAWRDADLATVFAVLTKLAQGTNPVTALEGFLGEVETVRGGRKEPFATTLTPIDTIGWTETARSGALSA
jgi:hypothetical protein